MRTSTHVVLRDFNGDRPYKRGEQIDASGFRLADKLVNQRYLQPLALAVGIRFESPAPAPVEAPAESPDPIVIPVEEPEPNDEPEPEARADLKANPFAEMTRVDLFRVGAERGLGFKPSMSRSEMLAALGN